MKTFKATAHTDSVLLEDSLVCLFLVESDKITAFVGRHVVPEITVINNIMLCNSS